MRAYPNALRFVALALVLAGLGGLAGCNSASSLGPFDDTAYTGNYGGTWNNTTFSSNGALTVAVTKSRDASTTLNFAIAATGNVFGAGPITALSLDATVGATSATVTGANGGVLGTVTGELNSAGALTASGTIATTTPGDVKSWTLSGTFVGTTFTGTATITFVAGTASTTASVNLAATKL